MQACEGVEVQFHSLFTSTRGDEWLVPQLGGFNHGETLNSRHTGPQGQAWRFWSENPLPYLKTKHQLITLLISYAFIWLFMVIVCTDM